MEIIKKLWVRIILSLFLGGVLAEIVHFRTGNSSASNILVLIGFIIMFFILSLTVWFNIYKYYFFPNWKSKVNSNENILDEDL